MVRTFCVVHCYYFQDLEKFLRHTYYTTNLWEIYVHLFFDLVGTSLTIENTLAIKIIVVK